MLLNSEKLQKQALTPDSNPLFVTNLTDRVVVVDTPQTHNGEGVMQVGAPHTQLQHQKSLAKAGMHLQSTAAAAVNPRPVFNSCIKQTIYSTG